MEANLAKDSTFGWKNVQAVNYIIGGPCFLLASVFLMPFFSNLANVATWLYIIGSGGFLIADTLEWLHLTHPACPQPLVSLNFLLSVVGSAIYVVGSAEFLPSIDKTQQAYMLFILASAFVLLSWVWRTLRLFCQGGKSLKDCY